MHITSKKQAILLSVTLLLALPVLRAQIAAAQADGRTFPETGKTVKGKFLDYWTNHGGLAQQGYPISDEIQEKSAIDGKVYIVQYFERAVFELHPENQPPNDILLSLLGTIAFKEKYPSAKAAGEVPPQPGTPPVQCVPTHDDSDMDTGRGFLPEAPERTSVGTGLVLTGVVLSGSNCFPVANAKIEMRPELDNSHPDDQRATLYTDSTGHYRFESKFPEHIHIRISAHGFLTMITNGYHTTPGKHEDIYDIVMMPDPSCRRFDETGQVVCGVFLDYWHSHGGLAQQGYPISGSFTEVSSLNGKPYTVQYFQRAVFELHPENQSPYNVLLAQLGTFRYRQEYPTANGGRNQP